MKKYLLILEVSQKQSFIFKSKKLKNNIAASDLIRYVTDTAFYQKADNSYNEKDDLVYSGGGHSVLAFETLEAAQRFAKNISIKIRKEYAPMEMFMKITPIDERLSNTENIKELIRQLEVKKSVRKSSFYQSQFGVEVSDFKKLMEKKDRDISGIVPDDYMHKKITDEREEEIIFPFDMVSSFDDLGGTKGISNFIAVVHIDGNKMGARVAEFDSQINDLGFEEYAERKKAFSDSIDKDFTDSYMEMTEKVKQKIDDGTLYIDGKKIPELLDLSNGYFPVRRIVMAGDDICFVTEGRIGIECAAEYIRILSRKKNAVDGKPYSACAGVAIVHQKYPFYRAYKLAEELCDNAKRAVASRTGADEKDDHTSAIDWHIEYGEVYGSVADKRKEDNKNYKLKYADSENSKIKYSRSDKLCGRPYIICSDSEIDNDESYEGFISMLRDVQRYRDNDTDTSLAARSKLKKLRNILKNGQGAADRYCKEARIDDTISVNNRTFDALEIMDTFIRFEGRGK